MRKGSARIALHGVRDVLVEWLEEFKTLPEMLESLKALDVYVSVASLHRYLKSEMQGEYGRYLKITGRGLCRNRSAGVSVEGVRPPTSPLRTEKMLGGKVGSPGDLHDFVKTIKV
jgi:hypothetical protein